MNGGYIIMPERLSNELMKKFFTGTNGASGTLNNLKEVCNFLHNVTKIGKPVVMSGSIRNYLDQSTYFDYPYCCYINIGIDDTFMLLKSGEAFIMQISNLSNGIISYHGIDRA